MTMPENPQPPYPALARFSAAVSRGEISGDMQKLDEQGRPVPLPVVRPSQWGR